MICITHLLMGSSQNLPLLQFCQWDHQIKAQIKIAQIRGLCASLLLFLAPLSFFSSIFSYSFFRVKLAIDLSSKKQVAIKIMRVKNIINKRECLECLFTEINILTECRHPNVVKILDASFDGTIVKEQLVKRG